MKKWMHQHLTGGSSLADALRSVGFSTYLHSSLKYLEASLVLILQMLRLWSVVKIGNSEKPQRLSSSLTAAQYLSKENCDQWTFTWHRWYVYPRHRTPCAHL
jgi:hypothetical protein